MIDKMKELHDTVVDAIIAHADELSSPYDPDFCETEAASTDKVSLYPRPPFLFAAEADRVLDPAVFKEVEKAILKLLKTIEPGETLSVILNFCNGPIFSDDIDTTPDGNAFVMKSRDVVVVKQNDIYEIMFNHPVTVRGTYFEQSLVYVEYADYAAAKIAQDLTWLGLDISYKARRLEIVRPVKVPRWKECPSSKFSDNFPLFPPLRKISGASKVEAIAETVATEVDVCAAHRGPLMSFSLTLQPDYARADVGNEEHRSWTASVKAAAHGLLNGFVYRKMKEDPDTYGTEIADGVYMLVNPSPRWVSTKPGFPTSAALYNITVFEPVEDLSPEAVDQFASDLKDKLGEMGYAAKYSYSRYADCKDIYFEITWISHDEWEKIFVMASDPSAIEAWKAGVPIDDIVISGDL